VKRVASIAAVGYVLVGVLAFVPIWPLSLIEHFRMQYLLGGIPVVVVAWWSRAFDAALVAWLVDLAIVAPHMHGRTSVDGTHVRVLFANVLASNTEYERVRALIAETKPDVIALVETRAPWLAEVGPAVEGYARIVDERTDNFALGLFARGTVNGHVEHLGGDLPTIVANIGLPSGVAFTMVVTHPWPPVNGWAEDRQYEHLAAVAHRIADMPGPVVLAGDLNATPWSRVFRKLVGTTGLCDTRSSYDGSYPASTWLVRIPIDHVLASCAIGVRDRWIGPEIGSDHLPVVVDLAFPLH
jgi:endonuclease/exonuclease/phosphatase (EEP) superfamily protein YafD